MLRLSRSLGRISPAQVSALVVLGAIALCALLFTTGMLKLGGPLPQAKPYVTVPNEPTVIPDKPCSFSVTSQPPGAHVFYQVPAGRPIYLGVTPLETEIRVGSYQIVIFHRGIYEQRPVDIVRDKPSRIAIDLTEGDDGMVYVPGGWYARGCEHGNDDERPVKRVYLDPFWIDRYEVSNQLYALFVAYIQKTRDYSLRSPAEKGNGTRQQRHIEVMADDRSGSFNESNQPAGSVDWYDAYHFAQWAGKRLPTEAEWEMAASWDHNKKVKYDFPWGNSMTDIERLAHVNKDTGRTVAVDSFPDGRSPCGAFNMCGNVSEWVNDWYYEPYYAEGPVKNPPGPEYMSEAESKAKDIYPADQKVVRGGSGNYFRRLTSEQNRFTTYARDAFSPLFADPNIGFRCARSVQPGDKIPGKAPEKAPDPPQEPPSDAPPKKAPNNDESEGNAQQGGEAPPKK